MARIKQAVTGAICALALIGSSSALAAPAQTHGRNRVLNVHEFVNNNPPEAAPGLPAGGFSGITHIPGDPPNIVYAVNDRGPHDAVEGRRTLFAPDLIPSIWKLKLSGNKLEILERITIKQPDGTPITGLPNLPGIDEHAYDWSGEHHVGYDPHGLDLEGIAYNPRDNTFWLCDEYKSLINVRRDGTIIRRIVPQGFSAMLGTSYVQDGLPEYFSMMPRNRGFEAIAVSRSGDLVFGAAQTPLNNPSAAVGNNSLNNRIVVLDSRTGHQVAEYLYIREDVANYPGVNQVDVNIGDIYALENDRLVVVERDKFASANSQLKKIYIADFSRATNVKGISEIGGKTLEAMSVAELEANGIYPMTKELLVDVLQAIPGYPFEKTEGMVLVDNAKKMILCADNDYGMEAPFLNPTCHRIMFQKAIK